MIYFNTQTEFPSCILNQFLWYNKYVRITEKTVYYKRFSEHNINYVMDLLDNSGKFKSWHVFKTEYNLSHKFYFQWLQLTDAIPKAWKNNVQNNINNNDSFTIKDHYIIQSTRILSINKFTVRKLYSTLMSNIENKPISQIYFKKFSQINLSNGTKYICYQTKVTYNTYL